ncbi:glycosyltransferase family 9 protein [Swingsia samuiensis]|uniref:Glycosyltransferase family 9 protein n=1 Tax=Swingsia samuiensis TaxID=1293412 RepID=A0A4Y6UNK0_9PROT|nr:glycosyltransferase family 9 protein [Swingsia samuiensis]QDH17635.1 glycosyltransferase family 9 protein [Swingsia samuiensis]
MRILFIASNRLGDAVISTGILDALQKRYPKALFTIVCGPVAAGVFEAHPQCERLIVMEKQKYDRHWIDLWMQCISIAWVLTVDLRGSLLSAFLWSRQRIIVRGGRRKGRKIEQLARALKYDTVPMPRVWISQRQKEYAARILPEGKWLALGPTANWDGKIWPANRFVGLAQALQEKGYRTVVIYGPGDRERRIARAVLQDLPPDAIDLGGDHTIGEVAALLQKCQLFVGNDSGLMHLAAAAGVPTLGLFGPSKMSEYAPAGERAYAIAAPGLEGEAPIDGLQIKNVVQVACDILNNQAQSFKT